MPPVLLATLGQRPEAITMALDMLMPRYHYEKVGILHTDAHLSEIADSLKELTDEWQRAYVDLPLLLHPLTYPNREALIDIRDQRSAEAYYRAVVEVLKDYRSQWYTVHLLVAGGRKAMSIFATLAAGLIFSSNDRVWTVLTPPHLMKKGVFHPPTGSNEAIDVIQLPIQPSRQLAGVLKMKQLDDLIGSSATPRDTFMENLTPQENKLTGFIQQHPYATNSELSHIMGKHPKTIENQLRSIYSKLEMYFDVRLDANRKKQVLLDVLEKRI